MSSSGEKTEEPTAKKLRDARKEGQMPQRKNAIEAVVTISAILVLIGALTPIGMRVSKVLDAAVAGVTLDFTGALHQIAQAILNVAILVLAVVGGFAMLALMAGLLMNKFNFSTASLKPKFEKLNPVNGAKQLFSITILYNFGRLLIFFIPLVLTLYFLIVSNIQNVLNASQCGVQCVAPVFIGLIGNLVFVVIMLQIILGALDFKLQTVIFTRQNKMTKDEVKREYKQAEGDPMIKGTRKSLAMQDAKMPPLSAATHVVLGQNQLLAFIYYKDRAQGPYVLFKMQGPKVASFSRKFSSFGCPVVNLPSQAKRLFAAGVIGSYLPIRTSDDVFRVVEVADNKQSQNQAEV